MLVLKQEEILYWGESSIDVAREEFDGRDMFFSEFVTQVGPEDFRGVVSFPS
jgi:hypothetical protein